MGRGRAILSTTGVDREEDWKETDVNQRDKLQEVVDEFRTVVVGRVKILDALLPPLLFLLLQGRFNPAIASYGALAAAAAFSALRLIRGEPVAYALGGAAATGLAILTARLSDRAEGYFLPNLISDALTAFLCLASVVVRRPLVALTSHLARAWPLKWYWHPRVRPAYSEVTLAWAAFFGLRLALQWWLFSGAEATTLGVLSIATGWPAMLVLLVASYLYGTWRLRALAGPSIEELKRGAEPPWEGQQRGF